MAGRAFGKRGPARWVAGSLLLHALLLGLSATRHTGHRRVESVATPPAAATELEVEVDVALRAPDSGAVAVAPAGAQKSARLGGASARSAKAVVADHDVAADEPGGEAKEAAVDAAEPPPAAVSSAASHLSLAQLGVEGANPFLDRGDPAAASAAKTARVKRRLDRALAQGLTDADVARGRGAGGPVLRSLEAAVYASNVPLNGQASFTFTIDSEGKLLSGVVGDASTDRQAWVRVARQTAQALAGRKLTVPKAKGIKLTIAVTSHLELPSGADPGLEVSAQGAPIKKGGGPRSTRLDLSIFPFPAATLAGDPADLFARPRRMVHAHVVSEEVL